MASWSSVSGRPRSHAAVKVKSMNIHRTEIICWILVFVSSIGLSEEQSVHQQVGSYVEQLWEEGGPFFGPTFAYRGPHSVFVNWRFSPAAYFLHLNFIRITCLQETAGQAVPRQAPAAKGGSGFCAVSGEWNARRRIQGCVLAEQPCQSCKSGWKSRSAGLRWKKKGFVDMKGVSRHKQWPHIKWTDTLWRAIKVSI